MNLLTLGTSLACGLVAGVFFAFSTFVMLAILQANQPEAVATWTRYVSEWTAWNHVRGLGALAAAALLAASLLKTRAP